MTGRTKRFVVSARPGATPPEGWQERLAGQPGVTVRGAMPQRVQVEGPEDRVRAAVRGLGDGFTVEEVMPRRLP
ncbi:hypothetical protein [Azospirillum sp. ST 5-10]|uniref:hypothetical protein n=1 Tax=unclassified Azospirillum TaxID=2630922 RepID=UPI003F4A086B